MQQQFARQRLAGLDQVRDILEVAARLFLGPGGTGGRNRLQTECAVVRLVTNDTARVPRPLLEEDRLDPRAVGFEVEILRHRHESRNQERGGDEERANYYLSHSAAHHTR